jgi:hypothetical protein
MNMPTDKPTGYETYIYDHKAYPRGDSEDRQYCGKAHDPAKLPPPKCDNDTTPVIMVEPCYASESNDVWIHFRNRSSVMLPREIAEQLRDALVKVCEKPLKKSVTEFVPLEG